MTNAGRGDRPLRLGLTLPSFQEHPEVVVAVAREAEAAGLDGVFVFDHLFRLPPRGAPVRPALEATTVMAAVCAATTRVAVGVLVARASLRPPALLVSALDTLARIAPGRVVAGLGAGDALSDAEDRAFGAEVPDRLGRLTETVALASGRAYPVWIGGLSPAVRRLAAARSGGWNAWGLTPASFAEAVAETQREVVAAGRDPEAFACSWGGLAVLGADEAGAAAKLDRLGGPRPGLITGGPAAVAQQLRAYHEAGAAWVIVGAIDAARPENAAHLAAARAGLI